MLGMFKVPAEIQEAEGSVCAKSAKRPNWKRPSPESKPGSQPLPAHPRFPTSTPSHQENHHIPKRQRVLGDLYSSRSSLEGTAYIKWI